MHQSVPPPDLLLDSKEVAHRCFLSIRTIQRLTATGDFPDPLRIGRRRIAWRTSEIDNWLASRPPARQKN